MDRKRLVGLCLLFLGCSILSGCITIEQELFLNADGSGEMVMYLSMPDLPDDMTRPSAGKKTPEEELAKMKQELTAQIPATLKLKEIKEVRQNGVRGIYAVIQFKQLKDVEALLASFGKSSVKESEFGDSAIWNVAVEKAGDKNLFTQRFLMTLDEKKKAGKPADKSGDTKAGDVKTDSDKAADGMKDFEEQLKPLILSLMRLRFTLHTPTPILSSNADIVLGERTAVWNCSLSKFAKEKTPIEMKASY
jgi:hypothetical protein